MRLVVNEDTGHRGAIAEALQGADKAMVAVAFLKPAGAKYLGDILLPLLKRGAAAEVFVGTDFFLTEPNALGSLLKLSARHSRLKIFIGGQRYSTFHPKVYAGVGPHGVTYVVGSGNLTGGALDHNVEASLLGRAEIGSVIAQEFAGLFAKLRDDPRFKVLGSLELAQYRSSWRPVERERRRFERAVEAASTPAFTLDLLGNLYQSYRVDSAAQADLTERVLKRKSARSVQLAIAALGADKVLGAKATRQFEIHLRDLMSGAGTSRHLWPSDAIYRQGTQANSWPQQMIELFRAATQAAKQPVPDGYDTLRNHALQIPGVGVNMITEILSTFAPKRYPVVNGNTRSALEYLGLTFPGSLQLDQLKPLRYAEIRDLVAAVRDRIGAADFSETDAFLNWIYYTAVRK